jgi:hypothetical protein
LIFYIKLGKPFCAETRNFDVKAEQQLRIKFCLELGITPIQTKGLLKLNECARTVSRTLVYPLHKQITDIALFESERKVMDGCRFSWKINVSNI